MIANLDRRYDPISVSPFMRKLDVRSYDVLKVDLCPGPMYVPHPSSVCLSAKMGMRHEVKGRIHGLLMGYLLSREGTKCGGLHWMLSHLLESFFNPSFLYELLCMSAVEKLCDHTMIPFSLGERPGIIQVGRPKREKTHERHNI